MRKRILSVFCLMIFGLCMVPQVSAVGLESQGEQVEQKGFFERVEDYLSFDDITQMSLIYVLLLAFLIGIISSLTPCIYPMIPITLGILQAQASPSVFHNFLLSFFYVTGIATVYATLGYIAATTTVMLGQWLANPWVVALLIALFLYLAFSMFGFYEIYLPRFLQKGSSVKVRKGSLFYSFIFGGISGMAASPCLTPPLALLLGFVATRGSPLVGFLTLFVFAMGMGLLLMVVGTFSNTLTNLPRAGAWMNEIKKFFGFLLIGVAIYFLGHLVSEQLEGMLYCVLIFSFIVYYAFVVGRRLRGKA